MSDMWKLWEGESVGGKFPLVRFLGGSEHGAVFLTERREGEQVVQAAIKLVPANSEEGALQLSRWHQAAELSHPHLIPLYEMGRYELRGVPLVYLVMECADENLAEIIPGRALTPEEAREMLAPLLEVLAYVHGQGFVHGQIKPANIMACADHLKVSSDSLRRAGEPLEARGEQSPNDPPEMARGVIPMAPKISSSGDVWSLGMTLVEVLSQTVPVARTAEQKDPSFPQTVPEPFLDIVRHCLIRHPESRWTVAQIAARLQGRSPTPQIQAIPTKVQSPLRESEFQAAARPPMASPKLRSYAVPLAAGAVLVLAAIFAGPKLVHKGGVAPQGPAVTSDLPAAAPTPKESATLPQQSRTSAYGSSVAEEERSSKAPVEVPTAIHSETINEDGTTRAAAVAAGSIVRGEVTHQAIPEVLASARNSIQGTVKVRVKVNVDRSGNVEDAELESPGPSRYFAREALGAAQNWKFKPPMVGGQGVLSTWILRFQFTRSGAAVVPTQDMP